MQLPHHIFPLQTTHLDQQPLLAPRNFWISHVNLSTSSTYPGRSSVKEVLRSMPNTSTPLPPKALHTPMYCPRRTLQLYLYHVLSVFFARTTRRLRSALGIAALKRRGWAQRQN